MQYISQQAAIEKSNSMEIITSFNRTYAPSNYWFNIRPWIEN